VMWVKIQSILVRSLILLVLMLHPAAVYALPPIQDEDLKAKADALYQEAFDLFSQGDYQGAFDSYQEALGIYREIDDRSGEAVTLNDIGGIYYSLGQYRKAIDYFEQALTIWQEIGNRTEEADTLNNIGAIYDQLAEYEQALKYYEQSLLMEQAMNDRSDEGATLNNIGVVYENMGQYQKALDYHQDALLIAQETGNRTEEGAAVNNIGSVYADLGQYRQALDYYQRGLAIVREVGNQALEAGALNNVAEAYRNLGQYQKSVEYQQEALAIAQRLGDQATEATSVHNIALTYDDMGQHERALENLQQALTIRQEIGDRAGEALTLDGIGAVHHSLGQYEQALEYFRQALSISREIGDPSGEGTALSGIGRVYDDLGQDEQAFEYYEQALAIWREIGDRKSEGTTLNNIGAVFDVQRQYQQGIEYYEQALTIRRELGDRDGEGSTLINIGGVYFMLGQYPQALEYSQQGLSILKEIGDRDGEGRALNGIGLIYSNLGQQAKALDHYERALAIMQEVGDRAAAGVTLGNIGFLYKEQGDNPKAISYFQQAITLIESLQSEIRVEELKSSFAANVAEQTNTYERLVDLLWEEDRFQDAFDYTERARARAFLDQLAGGAIDFRAGADADLLARELTLRNEIAALRTQLITLRNRPTNELDMDAIAAVEAQLGAQESDYSQLLTDIKLQSPEVAELVSVDVAPLEDIQRLLDANTTLIEYFFTEDRLLAFIITPDGFETVAVEVSHGELAQTITAFRDFASLDDPHPASLNQLYTWLITPLKDKLKTPVIGIIPHGILHYLPFAALTDGERYLGDEYSLFTLSSASALRFIQEKRKPDASTILALGNPTIHEPGLPSLNFAQKEVENIASLFETQALTDASATESALRAQAGAASMVHLAAHGQYNASNPLFSVIYLAEDQQEDGRLEVNEIYSLDLTKATDLVVLSACETQVGTVSAGDEVIGMTRAFLYAGTPSVIASLWKVDDQATTLLMEGFYKHLREGMGKAQALQAAQNEIRQEYPHPYYWAAFVLTGDPGSYVPPTSPSILHDGARNVLPLRRDFFFIGLCCFALTMILVGGMVWWRRRKRDIS
jgi:CHAT domain-containing protein/Tfp pilus assembly protein PilF